MVDRTRELELGLGTCEKRIEENERQSAIVQRRALYFKLPIELGEVLTAAHLEALRPAPIDSFAPNREHLVVGLKSPKSYQAGDVLVRTDWQ